MRYPVVWPAHLLDRSLRAPACAQAGGSYHFESDTYANAHTLRAAKLACGSTLAVAEAIATRRSVRGIALVRPPGHHAESDEAMGFCLYNQVAVAAWACIHSWGLRRVLVVDWDIHHGNGTEHMFYDDPRVLYVSLHRHDGGAFYPGTGHHDRVCTRMRVVVQALVGASFPARRRCCVVAPSYNLALLTTRRSGAARAWGTTSTSRGHPAAWETRSTCTRWTS